MGVDRLNLYFRMLAALCSVAVTFTTGCRATDVVSSYSPDAVPPLFSGGTQEADIVPVQVEEADLTPAQASGCSISFAQDHIGFRGDGIRIDGRTAVIDRGGVYTVSGECDDGRLLIDCDEPVSLILAGLVLKNSGGAVVECTHDNSSLMLTVSDNNYLDGGISSSGSITINGSGSLELIGDCALRCASLKLCGAQLDIYAQNDAIISDDYVVAAAGTVKIRSGGDGIMADGLVSVVDGRLDIVSDSDGIRAKTAVFITGGEVELVCGGGSSAVKHMRSGAKYPYGKHGGFSTDGSANFDFSNLTSGDGSTVVSKKGIRSGGRIEISGGDIGISSADDSLFARTDTVVTGGAVRLSSGDDAIHAERSVVIDGGDIAVEASYTAVEGLNISVSDGSLSLHSFYDGVNAAGGNEITGGEISTDVSNRYVSVSGGILNVVAGGDGIDSAGTIAISGGDVTVFTSETNNSGSLVYGDSFALSGGMLAAFGAADGTMAPTLVSGPCLSMYADIPSGSAVQLTNSSGAVLFNIALPEACGAVILSDASMVSGDRYTLLSDGEQLAVITATDGIFGGGPDGRDDVGIHDELTGAQGGNNAVAA